MQNERIKNRNSKQYKGLENRAWEAPDAKKKGQLQNEQIKKSDFTVNRVVLPACWAVRRLVVHGREWFSAGGARLLCFGDGPDVPEGASEHWAVRGLGALVPLHWGSVGDAYVWRDGDGRLGLTRTAAVVLAIGFTDVAFSADSVSTVLAETTSTALIITSQVLSMLYGAVRALVNSNDTRPEVVIVGASFGGLAAFRPSPLSCRLPRPYWGRPRGGCPAIVASGPTKCPDWWSSPPGNVSCGVATASSPSRTGG